MNARRILSVVLAGTIFLGAVFQNGTLPAMAETAPNANEKLMDDLLGPIALYPDPLLAQVLACTTSPQQVSEVSTWLKMQNKDLQGSSLQEAASAKGFDASFIAIVIFPDVLDTLVKNTQWTTEVGKAFLSDQKSVLESVQRLRKKAETVGNLKTTPQQEVKTETQSGQQVIVIQPANPQVVYVPVYNTTVVYTTPPPPPSSNDAAAAAAMGFMVGVAIGSAMNPYPYGWSAWGVGWHSSTVVVVGGAWHVPPGRYVYTKPMPYGAYRPPTNVYAPSYNVNNVNVNVNNSKTVNNVNNSNNVNNVNNSKNASTTPRPTTQPAAASTSTNSLSSSQTAAAQQRATSATAAKPSTSGYSAPGSGAGASATQAHTGTSSGAFSGYQKGSSTTAASSRGQGSVSGGGARRR